MVEEGDVLAQRRAPVHRCAQGRSGAVGTDQGVEADVVRAVVAVIDETRVACVEIDGVQAAMEVHGGASLSPRCRRGRSAAAAVRPRADAPCARASSPRAPSPRLPRPPGAARCARARPTPG
ncbi:hypothetical protein G6F60_014754 [Rhizopus arrhizus]|nr:hypothetical protein G6F60_014754 [Rhizopus arrhizus]